MKYIIDYINNLPKKVIQGIWIFNLISNTVMYSSEESVFNFILIFISIFFIFLNTK